MGYFIDPVIIQVVFSCYQVVVTLALIPGDLEYFSLDVHLHSRVSAS
jgi:hypothetical protein